MSGRFTMANMAIEAGAKNGIFEVDNTTLEYLEHRAQRPYQVFRSDEDAVYSEVRDYDVSTIEPQVACPHSAIQYQVCKPSRGYQYRSGDNWFLHQW